MGLSQKIGFYYRFVKWIEKTSGKVTCFKNIFTMLPINYKCNSDFINYMVFCLPAISQRLRNHAEDKKKQIGILMYTELCKK